LPFIFSTSPCLIRFDRDRHSRLRDAVTLVRSSLYIRAAATEIVTKTNSHENTNTSRFRHFCCCAAEATSSRSSTCICDRKSRSSEPSSSAILHQERTNKVIGSDLHDCSLASSSSPRLVYLFVGLTRRVVTFNVNFIRSIIVFIQLSSSRNRTQARDLLLPFIFVTSPCLIRFDRDRANRLRDAVTLGRSSLYIHVTATKIVTKINSHENTNTSRFHRFCCCAAEATSSRSSTCICDWESMSPEPLSSAILHQERTNKVFGKRSSRLLARFVKFSTTARLPLHRSRAESHRLQRELRQADRRLIQLSS
jgi:hypothetical protein